MRAITIIGAGQAGLQLALGLLEHGYDVTVVSDRTPDDIRNGSILSNQCMFGTALALERELGLDFWTETCPPVHHLAMTIVGPDGAPALQWRGRQARPSQSVDQRVKFPAWLELVEQRGGQVVYARAGVDDLEAYARESDLVVVAAGKGDITRLFERDATRSPYDRPQRVLAATVVHGMRPYEPSGAVTYNIIPGVGEFITLPALTTSGVCHTTLFEAIPGGPLDCWDGVRSPAEHLALFKACMERWLPWEAERCEQIELVDEGGTLRGRFAPTVRHPIGRLPSGKCVLGMGDTVVLNDPIGGQGSNNAAKCAAIYLQQILERLWAPFDPTWMQSTFDRFWDVAQWSTMMNNGLLAPPPPHMLQLLDAAAQSPVVADWFANGFDTPRDFFPCMVDPVEAERFIARAVSEQQFALAA